jgi:hypothetical protein
LYIKVGLSFKK